MSKVLLESGVRREEFLVRKGIFFNDAIKFFL